MKKNSILQVITLIGVGGSYGGPLRVAFELGEELSRCGYPTKIVGGVLSTDVYPSSDTVKTTGIKVKPLTRKFAVSSLYGVKVPFLLLRDIRKHQIIHIHFARDLLPITAALICIFLRKPFYLQTHGMIKVDNRALVKLVDHVFTKKIFREADSVLALQSHELLELRSLGFSGRFEILPNGIRAIPKIEEVQANETFTAVFCARLAPVKQVVRFIEIAKLSADNHLRAKFEIYGPDGGELSMVKDLIELHDLGKSVSYEGSINPSDVCTVLAQKSLLILPSRYDPFPVSVLEALSVGTPVLVNPSCGFSDILKSYDLRFVADKDSESSLYSAFLSFYNKPVSFQERLEIQEFTKMNFSIGEVVERLVQIYGNKNTKIS